MKIIFAGLISFFLFFSACSSSQTKSTTPSSALQNTLVAKDLKISFSNAALVSEFQENSNLINFNLNKNPVKILSLRFESEALALTHMMSRRVTLASAYKSFVEPYYGLVQKKSCVADSEFNADLKKLSDGSLVFQVKLPADKNLNLFDCEKGSPFYLAEYTFLFCQRTLSVFEIRRYVPQGLFLKNDAGIAFGCLTP